LLHLVLILMVIAPPYYNHHFPVAGRAVFNQAAFRPRIPLVSASYTSHTPPIPHVADTRGSHGGATVNSSLSGLSQFTPLFLESPPPVRSPPKLYNTPLFRLTSGQNLKHLTTAQKPPTSLTGTSMVSSTTRSHFIDVAEHPHLDVTAALSAMRALYSPHNLGCRSGGKTGTKNYKCMDCSGSTFYLRLLDTNVVAPSPATGTLWCLQIHSDKNRHVGHTGVPTSCSQYGLHPLIREHVNILLHAQKITGSHMTPTQIMCYLLQQEATRTLPEVLEAELIPVTRRKIANFLSRKVVGPPIFEISSIADTLRYIAQHEIVISESYDPQATFPDANAFATALGYRTAHDRICLKTPTVAELLRRFPYHHDFTDVERMRIASSIIYTSPGMLFSLYQFAVDIATKNKTWSADGTWVLEDGSVLVTFGGLDMQFRGPSRGRVTRSMRPFTTIKCGGGETSVSVVVAVVALEAVGVRLWGKKIDEVIKMISSPHVAIDKCKSFAKGFRLLSPSIVVLVCYRHLLALFTPGKDNYKKFHDGKYCERHAIEHLQLLNRCKTKALFDICFPFIMDLWRQAGQGEAAAYFASGYGPDTAWYAWYIGASRHPGNTAEDKSPLPDSQPHESYYSKAKPSFLVKNMSKEQFCKEGVDKLLQYNQLSATGCQMIAPKNVVQRNLLARVAMMDPDIDLFHHPPGDCWYVNAHDGISNVITVDRVQRFDRILLGEVQITTDNVLSVLIEQQNLCRVRFIAAPTVPELHYQCHCKTFSQQMECPGTMLVKDSRHLYDPPLAASFLPSSQKHHRSPNQNGVYPNEARIFSHRLSLACLHPYYMRHRIRHLTVNDLKELWKYRCWTYSHRFTRYDLLPRLLTYRRDEVRPSSSNIAVDPVTEDTEEVPSDPFLPAAATNDGQSGQLLRRVPSFDARAFENSDLSVELNTFLVNVPPAGHSQVLPPVRR
jgi:hypothetical protein